MPALSKPRLLSGIQPSGELHIGNWLGAVRTLARIVLPALALLAACSRAPPDATADGAVKVLLDDLEGSSEDPRLMRQAFLLLGPTARANLEERARHTSRLQGRQVQAWEMLAAGRFGLTFRPKTMRSSVVGDRATVEVFGADPTNEHASIPCVREAGGWRVEPGLPEP